MSWDGDCGGGDAGARAETAGERRPVAAPEVDRAAGQLCPIDCFRAERLLALIREGRVLKSIAVSQLRDRPELVAEIEDLPGSSLTVSELVQLAVRGMS